MASQVKGPDIQGRTYMTQRVKTPRVNAVYVVKNEWPVIGVAISHALTHYAEKVLIIDTGSKDGIFEGIKELQSIWTDRIELFKCNQEVFDQTPLTNLLIEMSKQDKADWTMVLDADEFFVHQNYSEFIRRLSETPDQWSACSIPVNNFIVKEHHDDFNLQAFGEIKYRIVSQGAGLEFDEAYPNRVLSGDLPLQSRNVPDKMLIRNSSSIFLSLGAHQVTFGDGIDWVKHDSSVSSADFLEGIICHLPFTSGHRLEVRLKRRFFDGEQTYSRLNVEGFKNVSIEQLISKATIGPQNQDKWLESGVIAANESFAHSIAPVISKLENIWPQLKGATYDSEAENSFPDSLDIKILSKLIRKYHSRAEKLWNEGARGE